MAKYRVFKIKFETDGQKVTLPKSIIVEINDTNLPESEIVEVLSDAISDQTGWLHNGFKYDQVK